ncbi:MAG TPA: 5'/3'-nucleotidase SurE [Acidimicrobiales bacterium]
MPLRVLVTNDDGVEAPGLRAVAEALAEAGHDVVVVAPAGDCSGQAAALGPLHISGQVEFDRVAVGDLDAFSVHGPPALCVMAACLSGFGPRPDVVVSGINAGANTGRAVLHSGTVGAVLTGLNAGVPGLAVSQAVTWTFGQGTAPGSGVVPGVVKGDPTEWSSAAALAVNLIEGVAALRPPVAVNLNVPNRALSAIGGMVMAQLDPGGRVQATMVERQAGVLEINIPERPAAREGTDTALLEAGYATVTALAGPHAVEVGLAALCAQAEAEMERQARRPA